MISQLQKIYLIKCWLRSMSPFRVTMPQYVNDHTQHIIHNEIPLTLTFTHAWTPPKPLLQRHNELPCHQQTTCSECDISFVSSFCAGNFVLPLSQSRWQHGVIQCTLDISRLLFPRYSENIHQSSPARAMYGVSFMSAKSELWFSFAIKELYAPRVLQLNTL